MHVVIDSLRFGLLASALTAYVVQLAHRRLRAARWPRLVCVVALALWAACEAINAGRNAYDVRWTWFTLVGFTLIFSGVGLRLFLWNQRREAVTPRLMSSAIDPRAAGTE